MKNRTSVREFILLGLTNNRKAEIVVLFSLSSTYLLTIVGNMIIIVITLVDQHLSTPMYFFLRHYAVLEIGYTTAVIPKALANLALSQKSISLPGCFTQFFLYFSVGTTDFLLLAAMSIDRYVAICNPLHYATIMNDLVCSLLVLCCWVGGLLIILGPAIILFQMPFCGPNTINHFFCDNGALFKLTCGDRSLLERTFFILAIFSLLGTLMVNIVSYVNIIATILRIPSAAGRQKAFSTCASHITVISITYGSCIFMYLRPKGPSEVDFNKVLALLNIVVSPVLNPFIYCLRNKQVHDALRTLSKHCIGVTKNQR